MYLDANNLYGWAMSQYLPTGGFKWLSEKQVAHISKEKIMLVHPNSEFGYFLK